MLSLVMNPGLPEEQSFTLSEGTVSIGRTKDNAVFCLHKSLSRRHAELEYDGVRVTVVDLDSKNGLYFNGKRVARCELAPGDSFRCGDITFLVEGRAARGPRASSTQVPAAQTLPSPFLVAPARGGREAAHLAPKVTIDDEARFKDKLFLLIRGSELCVTGLSIDKLLEELVVLALQVLAVDRIALLTIDETTAEMRPRVVKSFAGSPGPAYSKRVVDWVVDHGSPTSFADLSRDRMLTGDLAEDRAIRAAICVPINPGGGTVGVLYADSLSRIDCFRPDDLAVLRAVANLTAVALERDALRSSKAGRARD